MNNTIGGLPADRFVGRRVRLLSLTVGHRKPATLKEITSNGKEAVVQPDGHKGTEKVTLDRVHPWWSQNPDLQEEHNALVAQEKAELVEDLPEDEQLQEEADMGHVEKPTLPAMEIPEGVDFAEFASRVEELREAMTEEAEAVAMMRPILQRKAEARKSLEKLGVKVTGGSP